jgi:hypothetical protein
VKPRVAPVPSRRSLGDPSDDVVSPVAGLLLGEDVAPDRPIEHDQLGANRLSGACLGLADPAAQLLDQLAVRRRRGDGVDVGGGAARGRLAHMRPTVSSGPDRNRSAPRRRSADSAHPHDPPTGRWCARRRPTCSSHESEEATPARHAGPARDSSPVGPAGYTPPWRVGPTGAASASRKVTWRSVPRAASSSCAAAGGSSASAPAAARRGDRRRLDPSARATSPPPATPAEDERPGLVQGASSRPRAFPRRRSRSCSQRPTGSTDR